MKKILSLMLVLAMLAMMCINVSAEHFIGTRGDNADTNDSIDDGKLEAEATNTTDALNVTATVNSMVVNRYAVDLEYTISAIEVNGDPEWDVNELKYVGQVTIKTEFTQDQQVGDAVVNGANIKIGEFALVNYSDLGIKATADVSEIHANLGIDVVVQDDKGLGFAVAGAYKNDGTGSAEAQAGAYTAYMSSSDWDRTVAQMNEYMDDANNSIIIAKITFSVAPATANNAGTN